MQESNESVESRGLAGTPLHDHLCLLYQEEAEILAPVMPFIQKGIALGERCVYLNGGEETLEQVLRTALSGQKHDSRALLLLAVQESWLKGGGFNPARVLSLLQELAAGAAGEGFKALRIICDMRWAARDPKLAGMLPGFEAALHGFCARTDATLLCLYQRGAFSPERMLELARLHPHLVLAGKLCDNPFFVPHDRESNPASAKDELELFLAAVQATSSTAADRDRLRQELEQAYAALARKIYENWQEEDTRRASEKELQEKEEALLSHRRRVQTILQHLPAVLMAFDGGGHLAACNHEFERVTGYRVEEVMGKPILELLDVDGGEREEIVAAHPPEGGDYRGKEWSIRCKDGSFKNVSWSNMSRYVSIPGWSNWLTGVDVTRRVHAEQELDSLSEELDERTGELEALGQAVSYDLTGRLTEISGHCTMIQELYGRALSAQCREMVRSIHDATLEMVGRITALRRFSSLATAGIQPEEVDLSAMASEIAAELSGAGAERPVTFRIEDGVTATGDRKLLRLAMEQLLENAWNYTIGVRHPVIQFGTAEVQGERSYYVSDNGPRPAGDPGAHLPRRTLDRADRLCCGIGLATVQRIITLHRGRLWAAYQAGKGGTLYFTV